MELNEELASWINGRPPWQKDVFRRLCEGEELTQSDAEDIADALASGASATVPDIQSEEIPGASPLKETVTITALRGLRNVNALLEDASLTFAPAGLTVVFGDNGSGKSGYARVISQGVTSRLKDRKIHPNAFSASTVTQEATIDFEVDSSQKEWELAQPLSVELRRVRFYDKECGHAYVATEHEVDYRPFALALVDELSQIASLVGAELRSREHAIEESRPDFPEFAPGTKAASFLDSLSKETTEEEIRAATRFSPDHERRLAEALAEKSRLENSNPAEERKRLASVSSAWATLARHARNLEERLGEAALRAIELDIGGAKDLREAAHELSESALDNSPLKGVGSEAWRSLWTAAKRYSETEAYAARPFPVANSDSACVLCQEPLGPDGADRMKAFQAFVSHTMNAEAAALEGRVTKGLEELTEMASVPGDVVNALGELAKKHEDASGWTEWFTEAAKAADLASKELASGSPCTSPDIVRASKSKSLSTIAADTRKQAEELNQATFESALSEVGRTVTELQNAQTLKSLRQALLEDVSKLKDLSSISKARTLTATNSITTKRSELAQTHVTAAVQRKFQDEAALFDLENVSIKRTGHGRSTALNHAPVLVGANRPVQVSEILSEGEKTALGLAGFLTEVELDRSLSAVVFDDPVDSMSSNRLERVAERLSKLAMDRQVVVFTHDITFLQAVVRHAESYGIPLTERSIEKRGPTPGFAGAEFPWSAKDVGRRIGGLREDIAKLKKDEPTLSVDERSRETELIASRLSQAMERAVNLDIASQIYNHSKGEVRPRMMKILPEFSEEDCKEFSTLYSLTGSWARHDQSPAQNYTPPSAAKLEVAVERFDVWWKRIKKYQR